MQWFVEANYGMFIHFGLYSQLGGVWQGKQVRGYAEWIQGNGNINEKGGNLLLNVGPDGNGLIQPEAIAILKQTAELLEAAPINKKIPLVTQVPGIKVK